MVKDDINLLPRQERDYTNLLRKIVVVFFVLAFIFCSAIGAMFYFYKQGVEEKITQKEAEIKRINMQAESRLSTGLDKKADKFQKQVKYMKDILNKHIFMSQALEKIISLINPDVNFRNLSLDYETGRAKVDIAGPSYNSIADQIKKIRDSEDVLGVQFSNVALAESRTEVGESNEVKISVSLEISLKKEAWE